MNRNPHTVAGAGAGILMSLGGILKPYSTVLLLSSIFKSHPDSTFPNCDRTRFTKLPSTEHSEVHVVQFCALNAVPRGSHVFPYVLGIRYKVSLASVAFLSELL
jgi:hypothetical protein